MDGVQRDELHVKLNDHASFLAETKNRLNGHKDFVSSQMNHYMAIDERIDSLLHSEKSGLKDNYMYNHNVHSPFHLRKKKMELMRRPDYNITNYIRKQKEVQRNRKAFLGSYNPDRAPRATRKASLDQEWSKKKRKAAKGSPGDYRRQHMYYSPDEQNRKRFLREQEMKKKEDRRRIFQMNPMSREIVERRNYQQYYHRQNTENGSDQDGTSAVNNRRHSISTAGGNYTDYPTTKSKLGEPNISSRSLHPFQKMTKKMSDKNRILNQQDMDRTSRKTKPIFYDIPTPNPRSSKDEIISKYDVYGGSGLTPSVLDSSAKNQLIEELTNPGYMKQKKKRVKSHYRNRKTRKEMNENIFTFQPKINKNSVKIVKEKRRRREKQFFSLLQDQRYLLLMKNKEKERKTNKKRLIRARKNSIARRNNYLTHADSFKNLHVVSPHSPKTIPQKNPFDDYVTSEDDEEQEPEIVRHQHQQHQRQQSISTKMLHTLRRHQQARQSGERDGDNNVGDEEEESEEEEEESEKKKKKRVRSNRGFYEKNKAWQNRLKKRLVHQRKQQEEGELSSCTFRPKINKFRREGMTTVNISSTPPPYHQNVKNKSQDHQQQQQESGVSLNDKKKQGQNNERKLIMDDGNDLNALYDQIQRTPDQPNQGNNYSPKYGYLRNIHNSKKKTERRNKKMFSPQIKVKYIF